MDNWSDDIFLKKLASDILKESKGDFSNIKIILPSKRSVVFFRYYLSNIVEESSWAPEIITISEWISELTQFEDIDKTILLFELFKVVKSYLKESDPITKFYHHFSNLKYDNFYPFGETLLSDFNEIDAYNVDHKDLFRILKEHAEVDASFSYLTEEQIEIIHQFWKGFSNETLSKEQKGFIELWKFLPELYEKFSAHLIRKNKVYGGLNYKLAVKGIKDKTIQFNREYQYVFAGFNALNTCEVLLMSQLQKECDVSFYWDADQLYVEKLEHEAGFFIRNLIKKFPDKIHKHHFSTMIMDKSRKPFIHLIGTTSLEMQAKVMSNILVSKEDIQNKVSTAIILSDESFLFPTLYSLPKNTKHINVTMGYPIKDSGISNFVDNYLLMYKNKDDEQFNSFRAIDILRLLRNPFLQKCFDLNTNLQHIRLSKKKVFTIEEIKDKLDANEIHLLFNDVNTGNDLINRLHLFFNTLLNNKDEYLQEINDFEKEFFYYIYTFINQTNALLESVHEQINFKSLYRIINQGLQNLRVPFTGEPVSGMQIMGVLETRALDFKNIFILGLNEGIWPKVSTVPTLIPESIRRGFGLTTIQHQDSIFSYYFYRLLHKSEQVYLFYNTNIGDGKGKEKSRYITQLKELYPQLIYDEQNIQLPVFNSKENDIIIKRTERIKENLLKYAQNNTSASAINQYLSCTLKFYFKNILKLKEPITEYKAIGAIEIGRILHNALEYIYEPYIGKKVTSLSFAHLIDSIPTFIQEAFNTEFLNKRTKQYQLDAEDKIIAHLVKTYILKVLNHDQKRAPFTILETEAVCKRGITLNTEDGPITITIKGIIDRVDEKEGKYFLIDYKTGTDLDQVSQLENIFDKDYKKNTKKPKAILQMMLYMYLFMDNYSNKIISPLLYTIKSLKSDVIKIDNQEVCFNPNIENELLDSYLIGLKELLKEIIFSDIPFSKTEDITQCKYCPYINICGR